ncbi:hypothetical protein PHYSODRAFT_532621 [Phytophthora sojae]|uniref:Uncharacterized protein n=1 Tax=Phytophthora sojae (strain P6497) TaxID=1094619 RepID=G5AEX7_PHYSP|nr:hypothetical protein PHYSODRAFT_532621 [Phytophthora sojae]EGZ05767.1 hypothetical protein PHYSODRAFT_532621 [Phytophthora sojae]|eukprot:XP_009538628.1 hypothetical protein PHYSODRAFT_532621 [Phytophthora sojae]
MADANGLAPHSASDYIAHQKLARASRDWKYLVQPSVIAACLAVTGRVLLGPLVLLLLLLTTKYFSSGSVLIKAEDTFFAFTEQDVTMAGGCSGCIGLCKVIVLKYALFNGSAFVSSPIFNAFVALGRDESLYDFSSLSPEALELGDPLDANGAVCQSVTNEWGLLTTWPQGQLSRYWKSSARSTSASRRRWYASSSSPLAVRMGAIHPGAYFLSHDSSSSQCE